MVFYSIGAEQLGIELLGAILTHSGHEARLVFDPALFDDRYNIQIPLLSSLFDRTEQVVNGILEQHPDAVAFSPVTGTYLRSIAIAKRIKAAKPDVKVVFGGVHTSALPDSVISEDCVDAICIGEGEYAIVDYANSEACRLAKGKLNNIWYKDLQGNIMKGEAAPFLKDLDSLPFYDKSLFENYIDMHSYYLTMAGRGCPYRCTFCFNNFWRQIPKEKSNYIRMRSPDHVLAELAHAKKRYDFLHVEFMDDIFTLNETWLKTFLPGYAKEIRRPFQCMTHVRFLDEETVRLLKESGCSRVQVGCESANQDYRQKYLNRVETNQDFEKALYNLEKHNLPYSIDHIFGLPGEPPEAQEEALELYLRHKPWRINTFRLTYFPGTEISKIASDEGRLAPQTLKLVEQGFLPGYHSFHSLNRHEEETFLKYEVLFKSLPIFRRNIKILLDKRLLNVLPITLLNSLGKLCDVAVNILYRNTEFYTYASYYYKNILKIIS